MQPTQSELSGADAWTSVRWPIALDVPPEIVLTGVGVHGRSGPERYYLPGLWCLHLYPYTATLHLGDRSFPIQPGFAGLTPPNIPIQYDYRGLSQHLFVHFRCAASLQRTGEGAETRIPAMQDLGAEFTRFYAQLEQVVIGVGQPLYRAQARVWDMLCELAHRADADGAKEMSAVHPAVRRAVSQIERRLSEPLSVVELARAADVSYSYLGRLFQEAFGITVLGYIRARRMQRAEHLLRNSTLPIKSIAAAVGIPDLHLFNKTVRRTLDLPPRAVRSNGGAPAPAPSSLEE